MSLRQGVTGPLNSVFTSRVRRYTRISILIIVTSHHFYHENRSQLKGPLQLLRTIKRFSTTRNTVNLVISPPQAARMATRGALGKRRLRTFTRRHAANSLLQRINTSRVIISSTNRPLRPPRQRHHRSPTLIKSKYQRSPIMNTSTIKNRRRRPPIVNMRIASFPKVSVNPTQSQVYYRHPALTKPTINQQA